MKNIARVSGVVAVIAAVLSGGATYAQSPSPPSSDATGSIAIHVVPESLVFLDRDEVGLLTDRTLQVKPGRYILTFNHPEYRQLRRTVDVKPGRTVEVKVDLAEKAVRLTSAARPDAEETRLRVKVRPASQISVDGRVVGEGTEIVITTEAGRHVVQLLNRDYDPLQRVMTVKAGETKELDIDLAEKGVKRKK